LEEKNKDVMNTEVLYKLEEEKRKAEEDKAAAIVALETRSREFMKEKNEKRKLEEKIKAMSSQMLLGGQKIEDTPQFLSALEEKQNLIRQEYEGKLQELEKERQQMEESKAEVDKFNQILKKQRDIMIALTAKLNERDETILQLQEELNAYDRIHVETEEILERKDNRIQLLSSLLMENNISIPPEEEKLEIISSIHQRNSSGFSKIKSVESEEKIAELTEIIEKQQCMINNLSKDKNNANRGTQIENIKDRKDLLQELKQKSTALAEEKARMINLIENDLLSNQIF
jgi:kinesin family protein 3/17